MRVLAMDSERSASEAVHSPENEGTGLASLHQAYAVDLYRFALRSTGSAELSEDLVSEVFVRALTSRTFGGLPPERHRFWMFRVMRNLVCDSIRSERRRRRIRSRIFGGGDWVDRERGSDHEAELIRELMLRLPGVMREVLVLRYACGMDTATIAGVMGMAEGSVRSSLTRGRERLHVLYMDRVGDE